MDVIFEHINFHMLTIRLSDIKDDLMVISVSNLIKGKVNGIQQEYSVELHMSCLCLSNIFLDRNWRWLVGRKVLRCWSESKPQCSRES